MNIEKNLLIFVRIELKTKRSFKNKSFDKSNKIKENIYHKRLIESK